jgi:hypothetical protein
MKVQFANGKVYEVSDIDEAISKCLADGNDPFNPKVLKEEVKQYTKKTKQDANTVE